MADPITPDDVEREITYAWEAARDATNDYASPHDGERAIALSNLAIARAILLQAQKQDELIAELRFVTSGGNGYLEVRTAEA